MRTAPLFSLRPFSVRGAALLVAATVLLLLSTWPARADRLDTEFEKLIGPAFARSYASANGLETDPLLLNWVRETGRRVAAQAPRQDITYTFGILGSDVNNAFALPGGYIFVSRGMLDSVDSDDELASVLAHEAGHVAKRHATQHLGGQILFQAIFLSLSDRDYRRFGEVLNVFNILRTLDKSRELEAQADEEGIRYAYAAGYDPEGLVAFFEGLGRGRVSAVEAYLSTHPAVADRIAAARRDPLVSPTDPAMRERTAAGLAARGLAGSAAAFRAGADPLSLAVLPRPVTVPEVLGAERAGVIEQTENARKALGRIQGVQRLGSGLQQLSLVNSQLGDLRWMYMAARAYAVHERIADVYGRTARVIRTAPGAYDALASYFGNVPAGSETALNASVGRGEVREALERLQGVAVPLSRAEKACVAGLIDLNNRFLRTGGLLGWLRYLALEATLRYAESELARADKRSGEAWRLLSMAQMRRYEARLNTLIPEDAPDRRALWFDLAQRRFGAAFPTAGPAGTASVRGALAVQLAASVSDLSAGKPAGTLWADWVLEKRGTPENIVTALRLLTLDLEREIAFRERYATHDRAEAAATPITPSLLAVPAGP